MLDLEEENQHWSRDLQTRIRRISKLLPKVRKIILIQNFLKIRLDKQKETPKSGPDQKNLLSGQV